MSCASLIQNWPSFLVPGAIAASIGWAALVALLSILVAYVTENNETKTGYFFYGMSWLTGIGSLCYTVVVTFVLGFVSFLYFASALMCLS